LGGYGEVFSKMAGYTMQSKTVRQMGQIEITGNVIPATWFRELTLTNGKPNLPAIIILSDLVYWYKPIRPRDEETGQPLPLKQRFKADKLQRSYLALAEQYGFGKEQVREACHYLEAKGLITLEFRTIDNHGQKLANVMFPEIVPEAVRKITHPEAEITEEVSCSTEGGIGFHTDTVSVSSQTGIGVETDTNTEITTGNTTEITNNPSPPSAQPETLALEKPSKPQDAFYSSFVTSYAQVYGCPYQNKRADFVQLAACRKKSGEWLTTDRWQTALVNYFASPLGAHTLADLSNRFGTFFRSALDRYGKPLVAAGDVNYAKTSNGYSVSAANGLERIASRRIG